jgi:hypothetical protein
MLLQQRRYPVVDERVVQFLPSCVREDKLREVVSNVELRCRVECDGEVIPGGSVEFWNRC